MAGKGFLTCGAAACGLLALLLAVSLLTAWCTARLSTWGRAAPDPARPPSRPSLALQAPPADVAPPGPGQGRMNTTHCE
jgi:hypothetical protein